MNSLIIEVANRQSREFDEARIVNTVRSIIEDHRFTQGEVSVAIVDDPEMRQLNRQYLDHDYETDVLSFVMDADDEAGLLNGQLILSFDTAVREADELGIEPFDELLLYAVHGTLHLVGYRDKEPAAAAEMRSAEKEYLAAAGVEHVWPDDEEDGGQEVAV
ncbi:MAG: rRNA maturation RNase YbeY [Planctomycetota bacterium]